MVHRKNDLNPEQQAWQLRDGGAKNLYKSDILFFNYHARQSEWRPFSKYAMPGISKLIKNSNFVITLTFATVSLQV
jgi:hypothetical protein